MTSGINYDIEFVKGVKTALFGGEGLFFATLLDQVKFGFNPFHSAVLLVVFLRLCQVVVVLLTKEGSQKESLTYLKDKR